MLLEGRKLLITGEILHVDGGVHAMGAAPVVSSEADSSAGAD